MDSRAFGNGTLCPTEKSPDVDRWTRDSGDRSLETVRSRSTGVTRKPTRGRDGDVGTFLLAPEPAVGPDLSGVPFKGPVGSPEEGSQGTGST